MPAKKKIYKLPTYLAPREKNNKHKYKYIPKKIFQTGGSCEVTKGMYDAIHTWIDKNPDWEYHFFDNNACRDFIKEHFPKKVLDAYDNLIPGAYKADLWRYCVLYIHGGLYVDNKCVLLASSLNDVIPADVEFLSVLDWDFRWMEFSGYIYQAFICAKPKHLFFKKIIDMIVYHVATGFYGHDQLAPTGPAALGKAINLVVGKPETSAHNSGLNKYPKFEYLLWKNLEHKNSCIIDEDNIAIFRKNYLEYYDECRKKGAVYYADLWYQGRVYKNGKGALSHLKEIENNPSIYNSLYILRFLYRKRSYKEAHLHAVKCIYKHPSSFFVVLKVVVKNFVKILIRHHK